MKTIVVDKIMFSSAVRVDDYDHGFLVGMIRYHNPLDVNDYYDLKEKENDIIHKVKIVKKNEDDSYLFEKAIGNVDEYKEQIALVGKIAEMIRKLAEGDGWPSTTVEIIRCMINELIY